MIAKERPKKEQQYKTRKQRNGNEGSSKFLAGQSIIEYEKKRIESAKSNHSEREPYLECPLSRHSRPHLNSLDEYWWTGVRQ